MQKRMATAAALGFVLVIATLAACSSGSDDDGATDVVDGGGGQDNRDDASGIPCVSNADCADVGLVLGACQRAVCDPKRGFCEAAPAADNTPCDDGDPCTVDTVCTAGVCGGGTIPPCDDGDPCTHDDVCVDGVCRGTPSPECACETTADCAPWEDGDRCNGVMYCGDDKLCRLDRASIVTCPPLVGEACRVAVCVPATGACESGPAPDGTECSDADYCTEGDRCAAGQCTGTYVCTPGCVTDADCELYQGIDRCAGTMRCREDGLCRFEAGAEVVCDPSADGPCEESVCDPVDGQCKKEPLPDGTWCGDGNLCTCFDTCRAGVCTGSPVVCDDDIECSRDWCDRNYGCMHDGTACGWTGGGGPREHCTDGIDNDGDGRTDYDDPSCVLCTAELVCDDGADNDGDGLTDLDDPDCLYGPACESELDCWNGNDEDHDGLVDCADPDCRDHPRCSPFCLPEVACLDQRDNDGDGLTDYADPDCLYGPLCTPEANCGDGGDDDGDGFTDCDDPDCEGRPPCSTTCVAETSCWDDIDNDGDGRTDFADPDCVFGDRCVIERRCDDGVDDDGDGATDCADPDCALVLPCRHELFCADRRDDDGDGLTDCADPDCADHPRCGPETQCRNRLDDDLDGRTDCADSDCAASPACNPETDCQNGVDDDFDGRTDCADSDCVAAPHCTPETACTNGVDDDRDGMTDCDDTNCFTAAQCNPEGNCRNGADDDRDGLTDCADSDCGGALNCTPEAACADGVDNDLDGATDCADPDCAAAVSCRPETACANGADDDLDGAADCADPDCAAAVSCRPESDCANGVDDDLDGPVDCADSDCAAAPNCNPEGDCANDVDDDLDGATDCDDADCAAAAACNPEAACNNRLDDDRDGATDCADPDCAAAVNCNPERDCRNGLDDDLDGRTDCADPDCSAAPFCNPEIRCLDGVDNDLDGRTDCADQDCAREPLCHPERDCANRVDDDDDGRTDCADPDCVLDVRCRPEPDCGNGVDDDLDGATDCADSDCARAVRCVDCSDDVQASLSCGAGFLGAEFVGDTSGGADAIALYPGCGPEGRSWRGAEAVVTFSTPRAGRATLTLEAGFDGALIVLERDCRPVSACVGMADAAGAGGAETLAVDVVPGTVYYAVIDGATAADVGAFRLYLDCPRAPETCVGGLDEDEDGLTDCADPDCARDPHCAETDCGDGLDDDGDGPIDCADADCALDPLCYECVAEAALACGETVTGSTVSGLARMGAYPGCAGGSVYAGRERVYEFTADADGSATFTVTPVRHDAVLLVLEGACRAADTCVARADRWFAGGAETVTLNVTAGATWYVVVDGFLLGDAGGFALTTTCAGPVEVCTNGRDDDGDGLADCADPDCEGRACDDGDPCTTGSVCRTGGCVGTTLRSCDDGQPCTIDSCAAGVGCQYQPVAAGTGCGPQGAVCDGTGTCVTPAAPGDVVVVELLPLPDEACAAQGGWFELYNTTARPVDLYGWTLGSTGDPGHRVTAHLSVPAFGVVTLCQSAALALNGGVPCDRAYGADLALAAVDDDLSLRDALGNPVDRVAWPGGSGFVFAVGTALQLDPLVIDPDANDAAAAWCPAFEPYGACTPPQLGTPDRVNPLCVGGLCDTAVPIACGQTLRGDTGGLPNLLQGYSCTTRAETGGEAVFVFAAGERQTVRAELVPDGGVDLDLLQLAPGCRPAGCVGFGDARLNFVAAAGSTHFLVVDGRAAARGGFALQVTCTTLPPEECKNGVDDDLDGALDCADPDCADDLRCAPCRDAVPLVCGGTFVGSTRDGVNGLDGYLCTSADESGREAVFRVRTPVPTVVTAALSGLTADLDVLVLEGGCEARRCVAFGAQSATFRTQPGREYFVVVDGYGGAEGDFTLRLDCVGVDEVCDNGLDDDGDAAVDCDDPDCAGDPRCLDLCADATDLDGDGLADCKYDVCTGSPSCPERCDDGVDNDADGLVDCADPQCATAAACFAACPPPAEFGPCDRVLRGVTTGGTSAIDAWPTCGGAAPGGEYVYRLTVPDDVVLAARVRDVPAGAALGVRVLGASCDSRSCLAGGGESVEWALLPGGVYHVVVDGTPATTFSLELDCGREELDCTNGVDDDGDGLADCADPHCRAVDPACRETDCGDGADDDGDGFIDCGDPDCLDAPECGGEDCANGVDDDGDTLVDCYDDTCFAHASCDASCTVDQMVRCDRILTGSTAGVASAIDDWPWCAGRRLTGGERVYELALEANVLLRATLETAADLDLLLLRGRCGVYSCVEAADALLETELVAGDRWFVVVDGPAGAGGAFTLTLACGLHELRCDDGVDDDGDGATDCADPDCATDAACIENCGNRQDDDGDGWVDCADDDCWSLAACACTQTTTIGCNAAVTATTVGYPNQLGRYACAPDWRESGPERIYRFVAPVSGPVTARLYGAQLGTDLFLLEGACNPTTCVATDEGTGSISWEAVEGTVYYLSVDGFEGHVGSFTLQLDCGVLPELDCSDGLDDDADTLVDCADPDCAFAPDCDHACGTLSVPIVCGQTARATTMGKNNEFYRYGCNSWLENGGEVYFAFTPSETQQVTALLQPDPPTLDLDLFVLGSACNDGPCIEAGDDEVVFDVLANNVYYLVVDGYEDRAGNFALTLTCPAEPTELVCDDARDNDGDLLVDCEDEDCARDPACAGQLCTPDRELTCGTRVWGTNEGQPDELTLYPRRDRCPTEPYYAGETIYRFRPQARTRVTVTLGNVSPLVDLDLVVLEDVCGTAHCTATGEDSVTFTALAGRTYDVVVDGPVGVSDYTLETSCE
jgi:hypothetical protein